MSQVAENRARVTVVALGPAEAGPSPGWVTQQVQVTEASDLPEQLNLLASDLPRDVTALVPETVTLSPGEPVQLDAALVGPGRVRVSAIEPDPESPSSEQPRADRQRDAGD